MAGHGIKRLSAAQGGPQEERFGANSHAGMVSLVVNTIEKAVALDASSRKMLRSMAPLCLGTPACERHEYQVAVTQLLQQALHKAEIAAVAGIKCAEDVAAQAQAQLTRLQAESEATRGRLASEQKRLEAARKAWSTAYEVLRADWQILVEARKHRHHIDANLFEAVAKQKALEAAVCEHFGGMVEEQEVGPKLDALAQICSAAGMDWTLLNSFMLAARKGPELRTSFENSVVNEFRQAAAARAMELQGLASSGNSGSEERAAAEASALAAFTEAESCMAEAARYLRRAEVDVQTAECSVVEAEEAEEDADHEKRQRAVEHVIAQWPTLPPTLSISAM